MAQILVRGLDNELHQWLRERAARSGGSMEAEVRAILARARATDAFDPIQRILIETNGQGADMPEIPEQYDHEHAVFS